MYNDLLQLK